jgi:hypothetical protein
MDAVLLSHLPRLTSIYFQRLYAWKIKWTEDSNWPPHVHAFWGLHHDGFTKKEEQALTDYMTLNHVLPGHLFTDAAFRQITMQVPQEESAGWKST